MVGEQLSPLDALFLNIERPNTPMHTAGVVIFDGSSEFQKVYENIESRLPLVPRFFQRLAFVPLGLGHPFWVDDPSFDLSYHLRHAALPAPGTDEQLCDFAARVISRQLDRTKPLWEIYVIEGLTGGRSAIVTKTHHAMIDGLSSMDLATVLLDFEREPTAYTAPPERPVPQPLPGPSSLLVRALSKQAKEVASLGGALRTAVSAPAKVAGTFKQTAGAVAGTVGSLVKPAARSPLNVETGLHRRFAMVRSTLQTFKDIKNVAGSTVNDVILSVCADALGRLLRHRGERTEGMSIRVMVPVSVRDESQKMALGNEVASLFPDLPIGKMAPLDRLAVIHDKLAYLKESGHALGADAIVNATRWAPPTLHALAGRLGTRARLMNTVISNVPGPQIPLYSSGRMMLEPYAVIPLSRGQSLAIGVTSYNGGIFFGMNADRDAHPDLSVLAGFIDEAIAELEQAASKRPEAEVTPAETQIAVGAAE